VWKATGNGPKINVATTPSLSSLSTLFYLANCINSDQFLGQGPGFGEPGGISYWLLYRGAVVSATDICTQKIL